MRHGVGEAAHAVPAQLHVEVEPAADDVQVVVDQAGHDAPPLEVDASSTFGPLAKKPHHVFHRARPRWNRHCVRVLPVKSGNSALKRQEISRVSNGFRSIDPFGSQACRNGSLSRIEVQRSVEPVTVKSLVNQAASE